MRIRRIVHHQARVGAELTLVAGDLRHLTRVLRLRAGAELEVVDGQGQRYAAVFRGLEPPQVEVLGALPDEAPVADLTVAIPVLRRARMDWLVEKLSELGVSRLVPLGTEHSIDRPGLERCRRRAAEWGKQCGRSRLLEVCPPIPLNALVERCGDEPRYLLDRAGGWLGREPPAARATLVVGPEGGFAEREREALLGQGFVPVRVAGPTLRAETAAIAGAAVFINLGPRDSGPLDVVGVVELLDPFDR